MTIQDVALHLGWLMGNDPCTGEDYTHRRDWVMERLRLLVSCFAIDVGFFDKWQVGF